MKSFDWKTPTVPLGAARAEIWKKLSQGEPVVFPQGDREQRVIDASWLTYFDVPIRISNAVIRGPVDEPYGVFQSVVSIIDSEFEGRVFLHGAKFGGALILRGSTFRKPVVLSEIDVAYDLRLIETVFEDAVDLRDAHVGQLLLARGTEFGDSSVFLRLKVDKAAFFTPQLRGRSILPTRFSGEAIFIDAHFSSTAEFDSAQFSKRADFTRTHFGADAFFRPSTIAFDSTTDERIKLADEEIEAPAVRFGAGAVFRDADFHGSAVFSKAVFREDGDFVRMEVASDALFAHTSFNYGVLFTGATVGGDFYLSGARLGPRAEMYRMSVAGALSLAGADARQIELQRSRMDVLTVQDEAAGFGMVTTRGVACYGISFERFVGDWRRFLPLTQPFSRDPYDALERHLRSAGDESHARDVYFARRKRQGQELRKHGGLGDFLRAWFLDPFERFISRYGVRSYGIFFFMAFILCVGIRVFTLDGALEPKPPNVKPAPSCEEAVVYSVALVIPLVQLPPTDRWRPSANPIPLPGPYTTMSFETFSAIYRLAGFLFVPLAVAIVSGLLYRRDRI